MSCRVKSGKKQEMDIDVSLVGVYDDSMKGDGSNLHLVMVRYRTRTDPPRVSREVKEYLWIGRM